MEKKLIGLDLDDTLIVTTENSARSLYEVAVIYGLSKPRQDIILGNFRKHQGRTWKEQVSRMWPDINIEEFRRFYEENRPNIIYPAVEGAHEALEKLKGMGHISGILTNRSSSLFYKRMEEAGYDLDFFDFYYTRDKVKKSKDKPGFYDVLLEETWKYGLGKQDILYAGDTLLDLKSTRRDGIKFIAVLTGAASKEDFMGEGLEPERILPSIAYLPEYLDRI